MFPLIPILIGVGIAVAAAGAVAAAIVIFGEEAQGARIALLGPRMSGKSTLRNALEGGDISGEYLQTHMTEKVKGSIRMKDLNLNVSVTDPSGSWEQAAEHLRTAKEADVIVYIYDLQRVKHDGTYREHAERGARHIMNWRDSGDLSEKVRIVLVGTHLDEDPDRHLPGYLDQLRQRKTEKLIKRLLLPDSNLYVNLLDKDNMDAVLYSIGMQAGAR